MQAGHYSSLLPEIFRHKTTTIRVLQPKVVLMDFHGTISERRWEDKVILPYVKKSMHKYLQENWANETLQKCFDTLKHESFEQRFRHKYDEAPVIDDNNDEIVPSQLAAQVAEFVLWQMNNRRETRETHVIERLVWLDGYRRGELATPLFDDVFERVKVWREKYHCSVFVISSVDSPTMKLILEKTSKGNLARYLSGYISSSKAGEKIMSDLYTRFYEKHVRPKGLLEFGGAGGRRRGQSGSASIGDRTAATADGSSNKSINLSAKPILFVTDSGQEARAASQACAGKTYECLLVSRPGNKRIRIFYLTHFPYIETFNDIEFVQ